MLNIFFVLFFLICYAKYYSSIKIDSERAEDFPGTKKKKKLPAWWQQSN